MAGCSFLPYLSVTSLPGDRAGLLSVSSGRTERERRGEGRTWHVATHTGMNIWDLFLPSSLPHAALLRTPKQQTPSNTWVSQTAILPTVAGFPRLSPHLSTMTWPHTRTYTYLSGRRSIFPGDWGTGRKTPCCCVVTYLISCVFSDLICSSISSASFPKEKWDNALRSCLATYLATCSSCLSLSNMLAPRHDLSLSFLPLHEAFARISAGKRTVLYILFACLVCILSSSPLPRPLPRHGAGGFAFACNVACDCLAACGPCLYIERHGTCTCPCLPIGLYPTCPLHTFCTSLPKSNLLRRRMKTSGIVCVVLCCLLLCGNLVLTCLDLALAPSVPIVASSDSGQPW